MDELEIQIRQLQHRSGDPIHRSGVAGALDYLLARADEAHPRLLRLLTSHRANNPAAIIDALPRFGREESLPVLAEILGSDSTETILGVAASALARHPHEEGFKILVRGLTLPRAAAVIAAADGLYTRGDRRACVELAKHLQAGDANVRYHVVQAAAHLGCLGEEELRAIAAQDSDADIRTLASSMKEAADSRE
jgi:HEAT repeat protein